MSDLLTTSEVAKLFSVAPHTIRRWVQEGLLPTARTVGGHLRFNRKDVNKLLAARGFAIPVNAQPEPKETDKDFQLRVLIVDDEQTVIDQITAALAEENVKIESAGDGFQAGVILSLFKPHLVFLDLLLPDVEGFRICQEIRANETTKDITVVTITGFGTDDFISKALNAGANECLTKPLDVEKLVSIARETAFKIREADLAPEKPTKSFPPQEESNF